METLLSQLLAFATTFLIILLLTPVASRLALVDRPGGRKKHKGEIPLTGGIATFLGSLVGVLMEPNVPAPMLMAFISAAALLLTLGVLDDMFNLSPHLRFVAQATGALVLITFADIQLHSLGDLFAEGTVNLRAWAVPFTVVAIVGVINAMNMSDGMDGLAGGLALVALTAMAFLAWIAGNAGYLNLIGILIAAVAAFLCFNMRTPWRLHARIFMGDGGSMWLGFALAALMVALSQGHGGRPPVMSPVVALWIFALPLLDTVSVMLRRVLKGRSPFAADREHFHHILLLAGQTPGHAVAFMLLIASTLACLGVAASLAGVPDFTLFAAFLMLFGLYFWGMQHAWKVMKAIRGTAESRETA